MNENQGEELINVLKDIRDLLKPKQEIVRKIISVSDEKITSLKSFKMSIISDGFYSTLTNSQKLKLQAIIKDTSLNNKK